MRLICANCGAQYEIEDDAIAQDGRDVLCSACGYGWFQEPAGVGPSPLARLSAIRDEEDAPLPASVPDAAAIPAPPHPVRPQDGPAPQDDSPEPLAASPAGLVRRPVDPAALAILREEAAREARARAPLEYQTDLGLPAPGPASSAGSPPDAVPADPQAVDVAPQEEPAADPGADDTAGPRLREVALDSPLATLGRDGVLPDLTLPGTLGAAGAEDAGADGAAAAGPQEAARRAALAGAPAPALPAAGDGTPGPRPATATLAPEPAKGRGGFWLGFVLALVAGAALAALYRLGPAIGEDAPALARPIAAYVETVDSARLWLQDRAGALGLRPPAS